MNSVVIGGRSIGPPNPCFIIAEAGVNHNGDLAMARKLVDAAVAAGADAVKFQTFRADRLAAPDAPLAPYQAERPDAPKSQYELLKGLELPASAYRRLRDYGAGKGILFLSTPFDEDSLALLAELDLPAYKIPSGEIVNLPFLSAVAGLGKPVILSTGMASLGEIETALSALREGGCSEVVLLHCVSAYPAPIEQCNLRAIPLLARTFGVPVGFSDHTLGTVAALAAVALGACMIEKHFTLDRTLPGPDHAASLEPRELAQMVLDIRAVEAALGRPVKERQPCEEENAGLVRKSLLIAGDLPINAGDALSLHRLAFRRQAGAIGMESLAEVLGRKLRVSLSPGQPVRWEDLI